MKNYYNRLTKEEQKNIKNKIKESNKSEIYKRINIYIILTYSCILFTIADIYFNIYTKGKNYNYIVDTIIIAAMIIFYYKVVKTKDTLLNNFALELKKNKNSKE